MLSCYPPEGKSVADELVGMTDPLKRFVQKGDSCKGRKLAKDQSVLLYPSAAGEKLNR
jgi:hypothetical protein